MEMFFVIEINGVKENFESLIETQNRVDELRKFGIGFDIYRTVTYMGETEVKELGKDTEKIIFRKLHHMTKKKMFRKKAEFEEKIAHYKKLELEWEELAKISVCEDSISMARNRSEIWGRFARMEEENYNRHIEEMKKSFLIPYTKDDLAIDEGSKEREKKGEDLSKEVNNEDEKIMVDLLKNVVKLGNGYNGKRIGNDLYIYSKCLPYGYYEKYRKGLFEIGKKYGSEEIGKNHVIRFNTKNEDDISIMEVINFDTDREPIIGNSYKINLSSGEIKFTKEKNNPYIYHHKWMFVSDNYRGFDLFASKLWSIKWKKALPQGKKITSSIGYLRQWKEILNQYGLDTEEKIGDAVEKKNNNPYLDVILKGGMVEYGDRYYLYDKDAECFYYTDFDIRNKWKISKMTMEDFLNIDWNIV